MADLPPYPGAPRWVKVSGIVAVVVAVLLAIIVVTGVGGPHGPGRHGLSGAAEEPPPSAEDTGGH